MLAPGIDLANHAPEPTALFRFSHQASALQVLVLEVRGGDTASRGLPSIEAGASHHQRCKLPPFSRLLRWAPLQDLRPGQELSLRYSPVPLSNRDLLRGYGFTLGGNPHDRFSLAVPPAGGSSSGSFGSSSGGIPAAGLSLSGPHLLAALGLPSALLLDPSAGLGLEAACSSSSGSTAAERRLLAVFGSLQPFLSGSNSGASAPLTLLPHERQRERAAAQALAAQCWAQLQAFPTSLEQDEALLQGGAGSGGSGTQAPPIISPRMRAAVAYRAERKRLLRAAAAALQRYCAWLDSWPAVADVM